MRSAQLVQDARRQHECRARGRCNDQCGRIDLEPGSIDLRAVRLGLKRISGLREDSIKRIVEARSERVFDR